MTEPAFDAEIVPSHAIDIPLMRKTLEFIEAHPEQHDQDVWAELGECGTTACMTGWTIIMAGGDLLFDGCGARCSMPGKPWQRTIPTTAQRLLGLSDEQSDQMFWEDGTINDLWLSAEEFTCGELKRSGS